MATSIVPLSALQSRPSASKVRLLLVMEPTEPIHSVSQRTSHFARGPGRKLPKMQKEKVLMPGMHNALMSKPFEHREVILVSKA